MERNLLTLPGEIRNIVYDHYFDRVECRYRVMSHFSKPCRRLEKYGSNPGSDAVSFLYVCKRVYCEARQIFLDRCTHKTESYEELKHLLRVIRQQNQCADIRNITLDFGSRRQCLSRISAALRLCGKLPCLKKLDVVLPTTNIRDITLPTAWDAFPALRTLALTCKWLDGRFKTHGEDFYQVWRQPTADRILARVYGMMIKKGKVRKYQTDDLQRMVELGETFESVRISATDYIMATILGYTWLRGAGERAVAVMQAGGRWRTYNQYKKPRRYRFR